MLCDCFDIDDKYFSNDIKVNNYIRESKFNFDINMFNIPDFTSIDGYFQTDKYFKHCSDDIINILKFKENILESARRILPNTDKELVSIHIRRGDYTTPNQYHPLIGKEYVDEAIKHFNNNHFVIFSDDKDWCEEIWGDFDNFTIFYSDSHLIDFCAMSLCDHNIISNSSFSWWASYLSNKKDKKIIAPKSWFGPGFSHYILSDLYTEKMIII